MLMRLSASSGRVALANPPLLVWYLMKSEHLTVIYGGYFGSRTPRISGCLPYRVDSQGRCESHRQSFGYGIF